MFSKKAEINMKILASIGIIALIVAVGALFFWSNGSPQDVFINYGSESQNIIPKGINSPAIVFNNITLFDSTVLNEELNLCTGSRYGMNISIFPCVAHDVNGMDIEQFVDFSWNGGAQQNTTWIFVYEGELQSGKLEVQQNQTVQKTVLQLVNQWISNYPVTAITAFQSLGTPDNRCQFGNTNNTQMYNVTRNLGAGNLSAVSQVYCFTQATQQNATTYLLSGNADVPQNVTTQHVESVWNDVTSQVEFLGFGLLGYNYSYYKVRDVTFQPGQVFKTRWTYTPEDPEHPGKWHILGYDSQTGLTQSIVQDQYIYIDPWWDSSWTRRVPLNVTGGAGTLGNFTFLVNVTYDADMQADFDDLRFVNGSCDGAVQSLELDYEIDVKGDSNYALVWVRAPILTTGTNQFCMYYGNAGASSGSSQDAWGSQYVAVYHFNQPGSNDSSGNNNNLTNSGAIFSSSGRIGNSANLNDINDYLQIASPNNFATGDASVTLEIWARPSGSSNEYANVIEYGTTGSTRQKFAQWVNGFGTASYFTAYGDDGQGASFTVDTWNHLLVTHGSGVNTVGIYVNKTFTNHNLGGALNIVMSGTGLNIGTDIDDGQRDYVGFVDEARVLRSSVSSAYVNRSYQNAFYDTFTFGSEEVLAGVNVVLQSPSDSFVTSNQTVIFVANSSAQGGEQLVNITIYVFNSTALNYTNLQNISGSENQTTWTAGFPDGVYTWNVSVAGDSGSTGSSSLRTFTIDTMPPNVTFNSPANNASFTTTSFPYNVTINVTSSDPHLQACWFTTSDNPTPQIYTCNATTNVSFSSEGFKTITASANDSLGTVMNASRNITIYYYTFSDTESVDPVAEGGQSTFTLYLNMTNIPSTSAYFRYNNTNFAPTTQTNTQNSSVFTYVLNVPVGYGNSSGVMQFYNWTFNITGVTTNSQTQLKNQTVYSPSLSDCSAGGTQILNFTHYNEETQAIVNYSAGNNLQLDLTLRSLLSSGIEFQYNGSKTNNADIVVCVSNGALNNTSYRLDLTGSYVGTDLVQEFFYIDNGTISLSSSPQRYKWYDLELADSTTFLFTFLDENGLEVPGTIIGTLRYYIGQGQFIEVERSKEDNNGETHIHLVEEDVIYKFNVTLEGQQIFLSDQYNAKCLSSPCSITLSAEPDVDPFPTVYNNLPEGSYSVTANKATREVTLLFNLNQTGTMNLTVWTNNNNEVEPTVSATTTASSGQVTVTVPLNYGNATYSAVVYMNDDFVGSRVVDLTEDGSDYFGALGLLLGALAVLCLALIGASHGEWVVVWTVLGMITASVLYLVDLPWYAMLTFIAGAGVFLIKLVSRRRVS